VALTPASPALLPSFRGRRDGRVRLSARRPRYSGSCRAMAQTFQGGPAASYAREMERLSAKESLLLAVSSPSLRPPLLSLVLPVLTFRRWCLREPPIPIPIEMIGPYSVVTHPGVLVLVLEFHCPARLEAPVSLSKPAIFIYVSVQNFCTYLTLRKE
jgi:hypothetical protein